MASPMCDTTKTVLEGITSLTQHPDEFAVQNKKKSEKFVGVMKNLYDCSSSFVDSSKTRDVLPELIVKDFDDEQIWQQLELENAGGLDGLVAKSARLLSNKTNISFKSLSSGSRKDKSNSVVKKETQGKKKHKEKDKLPDVEDDLDDIEEENNDDGDIEPLEDDDLSEDGEDLGDDSNEEVEFDQNDKFFDFTGDSDEDLNFDFGPLGSKGAMDEKLFDKEESDSDEKLDSKKSKISSKKKSVSFEEDFADLDKTRKKPESRILKKFESLVTKGTKKGSVVDDRFFKLADLETFLIQEDKREERRLKRLEQIEKGTKSKNEDDDSDNDNDEDINMFDDIDSEDEDVHYDDFFDPPDDEAQDTARNKKPDKYAEDGEEEDDEEDDEDDGEDDDDKDGDNSEDDADLESQKDDPEAIEVRRGIQHDLLADSDSEGEDIGDILGSGKKQQKSSYELRQEKLRGKIDEMESTMLSERPWQMTGEITAGKRPENSLLQETLDFEFKTKQIPEITEETTKSLEELITQRIKDKTWDDVERKTKTKEDPFEYKKRVTLDQEKSKLSLGEIYEQEYLKQQQTEVEEQKDPDHEDIKTMMTSLFLKLDALSNFHYTPKQPQAEVQIISNQPSISMEEVAPVTTSDAKLLAPEEIQTKLTGEMKGATEKTSTDKLAERKKKKKAMRKRRQEKAKREKMVEKLNPGLGNKYSKEKALTKLEKESKMERSGVTLLKNDKKEKSDLTSSKSFFTQLQEEVTSQIRSKSAEKRKLASDRTISVKKFKL